jgi:predicted DNA-binding transcriptional regulator YafY
MLSTATAILDAIGARAPLTIAYRKPNGIVNVRTCRPYAVESCANGSTILRAVCAHQDEPRSFTIANILHASTEGLTVAIAAADA